MEKERITLFFSHSLMQSLSRHSHRSVETVDLIFMYDSSLRENNSPWLCITHHVPLASLTQRALRQSGTRRKQIWSPYDCSRSREESKLRALLHMFLLLWYYDNSGSERRWLLPRDDAAEVMAIALKGNGNLISWWRLILYSKGYRV